MVDQTLIQRVRQEMMDPGWCIVDTSEFFTDWSISDRIRADSGYYASSDYIPAAYEKFLSTTLSKALPEEAPRLYEVEVRLDGYNTDRPRYSEDRFIENWHPDGGYLRTICCVEGLPKETTEVFNGIIHKVPLRHTLIFTAVTREKLTGIRYTLHRKPLVQHPVRDMVVLTYSHLIPRASKNTAQRASRRERKR